VPFHSPMAIASFETIVDILAAEGVAREEADGTWTFDMAALMQLAAADRRWDQLDQDAYPVRKDMLVRTTDPRSSNSAAEPCTSPARALRRSPAELGRAPAKQSSLGLGRGAVERRPEGRCAGARRCVGSLVEPLGFVCRSRSWSPQREV